jgi:hypothetical protein
MDLRRRLVSTLTGWAILATVVLALVSTGFFVFHAMTQDTFVLLFALVVFLLIARWKWRIFDKH